MASISLPSSTNPLSSPKTKPTKPHKTINFSTTHRSKPLKHLQNPSKSYHKQISSLCKDGQLHAAFSLLDQMDSNSIPIGPEIYGELLQGCIYERALAEGRQIHARIIKNGAFFYKNEYIGTKILIFYAKCDCLSTAKELFASQSRPNVFSWAAMIGLHSRLDLNEEALVGFCKMIEMGDLPDNFVIPNALRACSALRRVGLGRGIHGYVMKLGFGSCVFVLSSLVDFYGKCGVLDDAMKVFEDMPERNVVAWNSLLVGFVQNGLDEEALEMFYDMRIDGVEPTRVSIASFLSASANLGVIDEGRQGHGVAVLHGLELDNILGTSIVNFYSKVGLVEDAERVFDLMVDRDVVTWNLLISGYVLDGQTDKALCTCHLMRKDNLMLDSVTLSSILSACTDAGIIGLGKTSHAYCIRNNFGSNSAIASSTIDFYASCGRLEYAQKVFEYATSRDLVLWNTLIWAYAQYGLIGEALKLFYQMQLEGMPPNVISWNSVILGFLRNGEVDRAKEMFLEMQTNGLIPNFFTWVTFIFGLVQNGHEYEAIHFFMQMQSTGLGPNPASIVGVLLACSNSFSLRSGRAVHGYIMRRGLLSLFPISTSLIDMYAKCGSMKLADMVFAILDNKGLPVYKAMISGLSLHGNATRALALHKSMQGHGIEPDDKTLSGLLSACSLAGLVDEGLRIFTEMVCKYHMMPQEEDYGYVLNLLACSGNFEEALKVVLAMSLIDDSHILGSLLATCKDNQERELGQYLIRYMLELEDTGSVNYITLPSVYAVSGRRRDSTIRKLVRETEKRKSKGTWIQIGNELHTFLVGDVSHPELGRISEALLCLHRHMESSILHLLLLAINSWILGNKLFLLSDAICS